MNIQVCLANRVIAWRYLNMGRLLVIGTIPHNREFLIGVNIERILWRGLSKYGGDDLGEQNLTLNYILEYNT